jgi:cytochrome c-type biogenesis protein
VARRIVAASVPFAAGFTVVFVVLGAGAAALGGWVDQETRTKLAGFVLVVLGLAFAGLLPWPERMVAPGAITRARASGSRALLGAAFAVCAAPCVGVVLGAILALAADSRTVVRGCILLAAYSLGITVAFVAIGIAFAHAMAAFRWVRNHYDLIRLVSGAILVALGLLLFFNRNWWLNAGVHRFLNAIGLGSL